MVRSSTGRYVLLTKGSLCVSIWLMSTVLHAAPLDQLQGDLAVVFERAQSVWGELPIDQRDHLLPLEKQIFTDLSPILDSPASIKLPEDQLLTD